MKTRIELELNGLSSIYDKWIAGRINLSVRDLDRLFDRLDRIKHKLDKQSKRKRIIIH